MPEGPAGLAPDLPDLAGGNQRERGGRPRDDLPVRLRAARQLRLRGELSALQRGEIIVALRFSRYRNSR